jgi:predicted membrane metal-binding protein
MTQPGSKRQPSGGLHENYARADTVEAGSDRNFGLTFAAVFAVVGLWPLVHGLAPRIWALVVAGVFLIAAFALPTALTPLKMLWLRLGLLLHRIVTPLIMGLIFYLAVTPTGLIMRAMGKDPLRLKRDPAAASYWIVRDPPGPPPGSMQNQF